MRWATRRQVAIAHGSPRRSHAAAPIMGMMPTQDTHLTRDAGRYRPHPRASMRVLEIRCRTESCIQREPFLETHTPPPCHTVNHIGLSVPVIYMHVAGTNRRHAGSHRPTSAAVQTPLDDLGVSTFVLVSGQTWTLPNLLGQTSLHGGMHLLVLRPWCERPLTLM